VNFATLPKLHNPALPTIWVDAAQFLTRDNPPVAMLRFYTITPEAAVEACRIQTPLDHIRRMIDAMAKTIGYYPTPPSSAELGASEGKTSVLDLAGIPVGPDSVRPEGPKNVPLGRRRTVRSRR
jgi:hypothetical protein